MVPAVVFEERLRVPADVFNMDRFRDWIHSDQFPERVRAAYIAGEIEVDMSPEELETHNKLKSDLHGHLWLHIKQHDLGDLLSDGALLVCPEAELATEPDMMFCSWDSLRQGRVRYGEYVKGSSRLVEVVGAADLVVEIVSNSSVRKDTVLLRQRYFEAGVREYWLIDARGDEIAFELLVRGADQYLPADADSDGYQFSPVLNSRFALSRERNPVGGFRYRLRQR